MTDDKPRKTLRLKVPASDSPSGPSGPATPGVAQPNAKKRKPVRWNPLTRNRTQAKPVAPGPGGDPAPERPPSGKPAASASRRRSKGPDHGPASPRQEGQPPSRQARARPAPDGERDYRRTHYADRKKPKAATPAQHGFFVPCPRGLEQELARELAEIGAVDCQAGPGGVSLEGDLKLAWKINLWSRLAIRVLWRIKSGAYRLEEDLYDAAREVDWPAYFTVDKTIAVTTVARSSPLKSLNFASLKIKDAVCDRFRDSVGSRPSVDAREAQVPLLLHLDRDRFNLYIDLTGAPLNRRGYRVEPAAAPINENLAAGLLRLAGWTPDQPLLDPMMGGGTLLLEAGLMALNRAPGMKRHFAFENLTSFDKVEWTRLRKDAEAEAQEPRHLAIYGCDNDPAMVRATGLNLRAAGLLDCIAIDEGDALEVPAPEDHGVIVSNPPYGVRLSVEDMAALYKGLGDALKQRFTGWRAYLISADPELPRQIGLKASRRIPLYNGPLECRLYEYTLVAGSLRREN